MAQGQLSPPPDGGYPGENTAEGENALFSLSSGTHNTAVGLEALFSNTDGSYNTANGAVRFIATPPATTTLPLV